MNLAESSLAHVALTHHLRAGGPRRAGGRDPLRHHDPHHLQAGLRPPDPRNRVPHLPHLVHRHPRVLQHQRQ